MTAKVNGCPKICWVVRMFCQALQKIAAPLGRGGGSGVLRSPLMSPPGSHFIGLSESIEILGVQGHPLSPKRERDGHGRSFRSWPWQKVNIFEAFQKLFGPRLSGFDVTLDVNFLKTRFWNQLESLFAVPSKFTGKLVVFGMGNWHASCTLLGAIRLWP